MIFGCASVHRVMMISAGIRSRMMMQRLVLHTRNVESDFSGNCLVVFGRFLVFFFDLEGMRSTDAAGGHLLQTHNAGVREHAGQTIGATVLFLSG